jgi:hypothetical protein
MAEDSAPDWPLVDFDSDPRLVVGFRAGPRRLDGHRIDVHMDAFPDLRAVCEDALAELQEAVARPYEPYAEIEVGEEYFWVEVAELPQHPPPRQSLSAEHADEAYDGTADLVRITRHVDELDAAGPNRLANRYLFYTICWPVSNSSFVGFVKKTDPRQAMKAGRRWFQYGDVLRRADPPDLVLEPDVDVVVTPDFIAARNPTAFKNLLNDVQIVLSSVPANLESVKKLLKRSVPLSSSAAEALQRASERRVSYARRLHDLPARLDAITLDIATLRKELRRVDVDPRAMLDRDGHLAFTEENVGVFLDVIESRYFDDELGNERRRADRYSKRM